MWKLVSCFLPFLLWAADLEVVLPTRAKTAPLYLSGVQTTSADWRYLEELRAVLEFDLNAGGAASVVEKNLSLEEKLQSLEPKTWEAAKIPFVVLLEASTNQLAATVLHVQKKATKRYPTIALSGKLEQDRRSIHTLSDQIHKDLFGIQGIASLRILYSQRTRNFEAKDLDWNSEIWICDADGANSKPVITEGYCVCPGFLPKKEHDLEFYYVSYEQGQSKIFHASLSHPKGEPMISLRGNQALPSTSSQGTQMAFITDVAGRPDLFVQNFDGKGHAVGKARQLFSAPRSTQASPTYSPDGKKIAFVSDKDGSPRIYLLDVVSSKHTQKPKPELLTRRNRENTSPAWSPDGKKLAYSAKTDGVRQIWLYDFATQEETQLTMGPENKENPAWAPNNLHLVYNTESDDQSDLYIVNLNDLAPLKINKNPVQKRFAAWEPR